MARQRLGEISFPPSESTHEVLQRSLEELFDVAPSDDLLGALEGSEGTPSADNTFVTEEGLETELDALTGITPAAHALDGALHTVSGLTTDHVLKATGATTFAFGAITSSMIPSHNIITAHSASGLTTGHVLQATGATTFAFAAMPSHTHAEADITDGTILARLGSNDTVTGTWTFNNTLTAASGISVSGAASTFSTGVTFSSTTTFNGSPTFNQGATFSGGVTHTFNGTLTFGGTATFNTNVVTCNAGLTVASSNLTVGGTATFNGAVDINAASTLDANLTVSSANKIIINSGASIQYDAQSTGSATVILGSNSPAGGGTAPSAWLHFKVGGGTVYVPAWT